MLIRYGDEPQLEALSLHCNTDDGEVLSNVSAACKRGLPTLKEEGKYTDIPAIICGGGPSIADTLESIRELKSRGGVIFALNNTAKYLSERGIKPDYQVVLDPRPVNVDFLEKPWADELLICSQSSAEMFDRADEIGYPMRLWHPALPEITKHIDDKDPLLVSVSLSVGLSALCLSHVLGYRKIHLFGYDSSHKEDKGHAYSQPRNNGDEIVRCAADNQVFYASLAMAGQANQFKQIHDMLVNNFDCNITVHGSGLLPALWRSWQREKTERVLNAFYDLGVSPPSFDFLSFLVETERYRVENGYDLIDLIFNPGPIHGFRDDDLPPDSDTRENMLWGICVAMARRLPSVRNVDVKKRRWIAGADVFPANYKEDAPIAHYGTGFLKDGAPVLKASEYARKQVAKRFSKPYATITLREAQHWPKRNSNRQEWTEVCHWLLAHNIQPVVVPDADGNGIEPFAEYQAGAIDLDLRCALYEGALVNLGVLNGPMSVCAFLDCKYIIFNVGGDDTAAGSTQFLNSHGFEVGEGFGGNGKLIWEKDETAVIVRELRELVKTTETV